MGARHGPKRDEERRREAERVLDRVASDGEVLASTSTFRAAGRLARHFAADDVAGRDAAEVWGTRIGRGLALVFVAGLLLYLAATYL